MKYIANPVEVDAYRIKEILGQHEDEGVKLLLENNTKVLVTRAMIARMAPQVGGYWVIQSDGYIYLNPKEVFERKYRRTL